MTKLDRFLQHLWLWMVSLGSLAISFVLVLVGEPTALDAILSIAACVLGVLGLAVAIILTREERNGDQTV